jgi:hypothetical protein
MIESKTYYTEQLEEFMRLRLNDKNYCIPSISKQTASLMLSVFNDFLFSLWICLGDTKFNKLGYRNASDDLFEQLRQHV